jgi:hypothetical protein
MSDQILTIIVMNLEHFVVLLAVHLTGTIFTTHHFIHNLPNKLECLSLVSLSRSV